MGVGPSASPAFSGGISPRRAIKPIENQDKTNGSETHHKLWYFGTVCYCVPFGYRAYDITAIQGSTPGLARRLFQAYPNSPYSKSTSPSGILVGVCTICESRSQNERLRLSKCFGLIRCRLCNSKQAVRRGRERPRPRAGRRRCWRRRSLRPPRKRPGRRKR